jgi:hypothetical protein
MTKVKCDRCGHVQTMTIFDEDLECEDCGCEELHSASGMVLE